MFDIPEGTDYITVSFYGDVQFYKYVDHLIICPIGRKVPTKMVWNGRNWCYVRG